MQPHHLEGEQRAHWHLCSLSVYVFLGPGWVWSAPQELRLEPSQIWLVSVLSFLRFLQNILFYIKHANLCRRPDSYYYWFCFSFESRGPRKWLAKAFWGSQVVCGAWPAGWRGSCCPSAWSTLDLCRTGPLATKKRKIEWWEHQVRLAFIFNSREHRKAAFSSVEPDCDWLVACCQERRQRNQLESFFGAPSCRRQYPLSPS